MKISIRRLHKWIGIAIGVVVLLWIGTGVLMILPHRRVTGSAPAYQWHLALVSPAQAAATARGLAGTEDGLGPEVSGMALHRLADVLVFRVHLSDGSTRLIDAATGAPATMDEVRASRVAQLAFGVDRPPASVERLEHYDVRYAAGPLPAIRVAFDDPAGTVAYVGVEDGTVRGGGTGHRVRAVVSGLHTFYPLRALVRSARMEIGLLLLACAVAVAGVLTGYWLALPRQLRLRR